MISGFIDWFVLVLSVLIIVKILFVAFNAKGWLSFGERLYSSPIVLVLAEAILAAVLFYYLLMQITIVQIMASLGLGALLTGIVFAVYPKETMAWAGKFLKRKTILDRAWLPIIIWLVLAVWALSALL